MSILIAHEAPVSIIDFVADRTDYSYALVHLFDQNPAYKKHFELCIATGREVLLDNSIFELKKAFDPVKYGAVIDKLVPTMYIMPDVLEDSQQTITNAKCWNITHGSLPGLRIGAVQGSTYSDIVECYKAMVDYADIIAISFDLSWYDYVGTHIDLARQSLNGRLQRQCTGRQHLITRLIDDGIWQEKKPHHLLGNSLAREGIFYRDQKIRGIRSVDTSNPVMAGLRGQRYIEGIGLNDKPTELLADNINTDVSIEQICDIEYNINEFRKLYC